MTRRTWLLLVAASALCLGQAACNEPTTDKKKGKGGKEAEIDTTGMTTTKSGLKYKDLKEGKGPAADTGDTVEVYYTGWLADGTKFDSNVGKDPFEVTIGKTKVIEGWTEGLKGMKASSKRKLVIPPDLAYGKKGRGPIPPDATLIFEVEMVKIGQ